MNQSLLGFYSMLYVVPEPQTDPEPLDIMPTWVPAPTLVFHSQTHKTGWRTNILSAQASITTKIVVLTNTNWSKLRGNQGTGAELVIGRNWSPVEEAIGTSRLEWGGSSGGSRGRGAGAHGRLRRTEMVHVTLKHKHQTLNTIRSVWRCTWTMAGSWGKEHVGLGGSHTVRSLMSLPLKMMYSKVSSRGGMGLSVGRSSVPKERTDEKEAAHS